MTNTTPDFVCVPLQLRARCELADTLVTEEKNKLAASRGGDLCTELRADSRMPMLRKLVATRVAVGEGSLLSVICDLFVTDLNGLDCLALPCHWSGQNCKFPI